MTLKVLAEVYPSDLGRVIYRINKYMRMYAPEDVEFVTNKTVADLQILDVIGIGSLEYKFNKNIVYLQHCYLTAETMDYNYWHPLWNSAKLVATYMDLPRVANDSDFNFLRMPWGVDPKVFNKLNLCVLKKHYKVLTTGYVSSMESIDEVSNAIITTKNRMAHVGHNFKFGEHFSHFENITDQQFNFLYNNTEYVAGLRVGEGFELPIIEGLLCGARGICFNADHYRYWYGDLVEYIEELDSKRVYEQLVELFNKPVRTVSKEEIELVKTKFSWKNIMTTLWSRIKEAV